jgi:DNA modification methylase
MKGEIQKNFIWEFDETSSGSISKGSESAFNSSTRISPVFDIHNLDARKLDSVLSANTVDVTVTSPPYFDLKNYDHKDQIGYGQTYEEYLSDLEMVFGKVYKVTKNTGSLWVIIDMFKKEGEVIPLPFDFVARIKQVGWKLQEVIIWEKDRTVPWAREGQVRNSFEYILVFSKSDKYKFNIERAKTIDTLKKWWVRYPERYHPKGKSPTGIWNFPIPTQGSWGNGYIRHFCPLPEDLISQILNITTDENDVVLDPFAGSGAVLSRAANMKRTYVGFELNPKYIWMFTQYLKETGRAKGKAYDRSKSPEMEQIKFERLILQLRQLKYARVIFQQVKNRIQKPLIQKIFVPASRASSKAKHKILKSDYHVLTDGSNSNELIKILEEMAAAPPLSKFGIEHKFVLHTTLSSFTKFLGNRSLYTYTSKNTHSFKKKFVLSDLSKGPNDDVILSNIKLSVDESIYE